MEGRFTLTESEQEIQAFIRMIPGVTSENYYVMHMLALVGECSFFEQYFPAQGIGPVFECLRYVRISPKCVHVTLDRDRMR